MTTARGSKVSSWVGWSLFVMTFGACVRTDPSGNSPTSPCESGTLRCACYRNQTCDDGLSCLSDICVELTPTKPGGDAGTSNGSAFGSTLGGGAFPSGGQSTVIIYISAGVGGSGALGGTVTNVGLPAGSSGVLEVARGGVAGAATSSGGMATGGGAGVAGRVTSPIVTTGGMAAGGGAGVAGGMTSPITTTGGNLGAAGSSGIPCTTTTNLIADASTNRNAWYGGDPATADDNVCGAQGYVRAYSDKGVDNVPGGADASVQSPPLDASTSKFDDFMSPCVGGKCCIRGATNTWPKRDGASDYYASVWGGGLRITLNEFGDSDLRNPFAGRIRGFKVKTSGMLNGQKIRFGYGQSANDACIPFIERNGLGEYDLPFVGVIACPTWSCDPSCVSPKSMPYDFEVQVVGGDIAGDFELCIDSLTPLL